MTEAGAARGMSERAYARHIGKSRGSVQKLRATGRLVLHADGSIDAAASDAHRLQTGEPARQTPPVQPAAASAAGMQPVPDAAVGPSPKP